MTKIARCVVVLMLLGISAGNAENLRAGKELYNGCISCHGDKSQGNTALNAPALTGQSAEYLSRQLKHFKSGIRGGATLADPMRGMAATLVDEKATEDVAAYIASLPVTFPDTAASGDLRKGNNLYQGNCGACHGGKAEGNAALKSPRLAGLDADYLIRQYQQFNTGERGKHPDDRYGRQMRMMANSLSSPAALADVVAYIHSLPRK